MDDAYFCQQGKESDMDKVAKAHEFYWTGREKEADALLEKDIGEYFGYSPADCKLFQSWRHRLLTRLPVIESRFQSYNDEKRAKRITALLGERSPI